MTVSIEAVRIGDALAVLLGGRSYLAGETIVDRLIQRTGYDRATILGGLSDLAREGLVTGVASSGTPIGRVSYHGIRPSDPEPDPLVIAWRDAVSATGLAEGLTGHLATVGADLLEGLTADHLKALARGLADLLCADGAHEERQAASARHLLGSAKALDRLASILMRCGYVLPPATSYFMAAGPTEPGGLLFIENPAAFETAMAAGLGEGAMLVTTFGYGLGWTNPGFTNAVLLKRAGDPPALPTVIERLTLEDRPLLFWGDLDLAGLDIFAKLKTRMPTLRLSALYGPMIEARRATRWHPYGKLADKTRQAGLSLAKCDEPGFQDLVELCRAGGVDQEIVDGATIGAVGLTVLNSVTS
jgi:hypothetical protein